MAQHNTIASGHRLQQFIVSCNKMSQGRAAPVLVNPVTHGFITSNPGSFHLSLYHPQHVSLAAGPAQLQSWLMVIVVDLAMTTANRRRQKISSCVSLLVNEEAPLRSYQSNSFHSPWAMTEARAFSITNHLQRKCDHHDSLDQRFTTPAYTSESLWTSKNICPRIEQWNMNLWGKIYAMALHLF